MTSNAFYAKTMSKASIGFSLPTIISRATKIGRQFLIALSNYVNKTVWTFAS